MRRVDDRCAGGNDKGWSADLARELWLSALSAWEAFVFVCAGLSLDEVRSSPFALAALREAAGRARELAEFAYGLARAMCIHGTSERDLRSSLRAARRVSEETWARAQVLAPRVVSAREESLADEALMLSDGTAREMAEHFERARGGVPFTAEAMIVTAARSANVTIGVLLSPVPQRPFTSPGAVWAHLLSVGDSFKKDERLRPLAPVVVFVEAARLASFGEDAWKTPGRMPSFGVRADAYLAKVDDYDGPRTLAQKALQALGHTVDEFTTSGRSKKYRAEVRKAADRSKKRPRG